MLFMVIYIYITYMKTGKKEPGNRAFRVISQMFQLMR